MPDTRYTDEPWEADLPEDWRDRPAWTSEIEVFVKRVQTHGRDRRGHDHRDRRELLAASQPGFSPGTWDAPSGLQRNDSYYARGARTRTRRATGIEEATLDEGERQDGMRTLTVPFQPGQGIRRPQGAFSSTRPVGEARVHFAPFGSMEPSSATYPRTAARSSARSTRSWPAPSTRARGSSCSG